MSVAPKTYCGKRIDGRPVVEVFQDGVYSALAPRLELCNHSPDGFEWGYGGSGPAQLALAIIADATGNDVLAVNTHQLFKAIFVGRLDKDKAWAITEGRVRAIVAQSGAGE